MTGNLPQALYRFAGRVPITRYLEAAYILLLPVILAFLYRFSPFNNNDGFLDAWIYFAYAHNFQDLIDRYGLPYYSVRFGLIFPLIVLIKIFGAVKGYLAFVYLMYLLAGVPLYLLFRKRFSVQAAVLAYAILVSSVWFARTVLWTHPDASAVPYLLAATALMFLDPRHKRTSNLAVGMLIALAANSNIFALSIGGLLGVAYLVYYKNTIWERLRRDVPWMMVGFIGVLVAGMAGFYMCCGQINYFGSTLGMVLWSVKGSGQVYQINLSELLKLNYLYLPPFLLCSMVIILWRRLANVNDRPILIASSGYLGAVILFFIWYQFSTKTAILEHFYYFCFFLVPSVICISIVPVILAGAGNSGTRLTISAIVSFLIPPLIIAYGFPEILKHVTTYWVWAGLAFALLVLWLSDHFKGLIPYAVLAFALSIQLPLWSTVMKGMPFYARMYGMADEAGLSRYRLGLKFIEVMPKFREERRHIYFWYSNNDGLANSLQSTYLWGYSRLPDYSNGVSGYPAFKGKNLDFLNKQEKYTLIMFDREKRNVDRGIAELRHVGFRFDIKHAGNICEQTLCYSIAVLDMDGFRVEQDQKDGGGSPVAIKLNWSSPAAGARIERIGDMASVATPPDAWNYGVIASVVFSRQLSARRGVVRVRVSVKEASAGLGFTGSNISDFIKRVEVRPMSEPQEILFEVGNLKELENFVIQTWDQNKSAIVEILEISVREQPDAKK